ncbi:lysine 5,6-aminomutase reactivase subunit KamB [Tepidimicrobium xylanilyticum]|uniref:Molybdopterin-guanine dinucleotide biosynthesis protein n=1 Tax=Tepidimicrobium xylanilyticum TaxID=1123352 RepID=A0A1H2WBR1_9FIRM|nr:hypothetical protein [Tepidimicrobium xylanilyticum]SDW78113.1 Molybdopterin-guanine dinucleotide biosynthesis protein [Tepidimicrobium xylanilyticum]
MLLQHIQDKYKIISIVGMAKNSGKTVALNHLIQESLDEGIQLGIVSTGRDGESLDLVTETEKPKIFVEEGVLIATTTELLSLSDATVEIIDITGYRTPLGEILIGRIKDSGYIQISGPQTTVEIKEIADSMIKLGAELVLVDGAIDRKSSAAPSITDATILATGAVLSRDMTKVIEETLHIVNLFNLPPVDINDRPILERAFENGDISTVDENLNCYPLGIKTALNCGHIIGQHIKEDTKYILIPGSLVKNTVEGIIETANRYKKVVLVVSDGTKIFIPPKDWLRFVKHGLKVKVINPINLVAITLNPYAPQGYYFDARELLDRMRYYIKDIPVVDLVLGSE